MKLAIPLMLVATASCTEALTIEIRYELAGSSFYNQAGAKEALRAAADFYEDLISDSLGAINPAQYPGAAWTPTYASPVNGNTVNMNAQANLVVPANTIIIYAGSMNLGAAAARAGAGGINLGGSSLAWWNQVYNRGEPGAVQLVQVGGNVNFTSNPTDFAPWGGVIFFNSSIANWNFSTSNATGTAGPDALSVALHELGHVLGLGTYRADCSWTTLINQANGKFMGPLALSSFGVNPQTDAVHVLPGVTKSRAYGCFGVPHGTAVFPLMSESLPVSNTFDVPTDLDLAMLRDIGWELTLPERQIGISKSAGAASVSVPTSTGFNYEIRRSTNLSSWGAPLATLQGNGQVKSWADSTVPSKAFYRMTRVATTPASAVTLAVKDTGDSVLLPAPVIKPVMCECDGAH